MHAAWMLVSVAAERPITGAPAATNASAFHREAAQLHALFKERKCVTTTALPRCRIDPGFGPRAVEAFMEDTYAESRPGGKFCPVRVFPRVPSRQEFVDQRLHREPFLFRFDPAAFDLRALVERVHGCHTAAHYDSTFGNLGTRRLNPSQTACSLSTMPLLKHLYGLTPARANMSETANRGLPQCDAGARPLCMDLCHGERLRTFEAGLGGIRAPKTHANMSFSVGNDISPQLWEDTIGSIGSLGAWGGRKAINKKDPKARRVLFGGPGWRTPFHIDHVQQVLSQFHGEKYVFMALLPTRKFARQMEARLGYVGSPVLSRPNLPVHSAYGCTLRPGEALFMPHSLWHDVLTVSPSVSLGSRFRYAPPYPRMSGRSKSRLLPGRNATNLTKAMRMRRGAIRQDRNPDHDHDFARRLSERRRQEERWEEQAQ